MIATIVWGGLKAVVWSLAVAVSPHCCWLG